MMPSLHAVYNEEVRDLMATDENRDAALAIWEDRRRGVFVSSN